MGGKGSGGKRPGAGRTTKLTYMQKLLVCHRCNELRSQIVNKEIDAARAAKYANTVAQQAQATAGEEGMTLAERAARRQRWLKMPVGRGHHARFEEALREDQDLDEGDMPARAIRIFVALCRRTVEAKVKKLVQAEARERFGTDVSVKTIGRIWKRQYLTSEAD
jgi:hypothetical protein